MDKISEIFEKMNYGPENSEALDDAEGWMKEKVFGPFVDGKVLSESDRNTKEIIRDENDGKELTQSFLATEEDAATAIASSKLASCVWEKMGVSRGDVMLAIASAFGNRHHLVAHMEALSHSMHYRDAFYFDVPHIIRSFEHYGGWALLGSKNTDWEPYGVISIICSQTTLAALGWAVAPALAAGNAVILCVPKEMVLTARLFAEICYEAGLPKGVLNVLPCDKNVLRCVLPEVKKASVLGPTQYGREVAKSLAATPNKMSSILTGKSPMIVFNGADIESAVVTAVKSAWTNQGAAPWSVRTILVEETVSDLLIVTLKETIESMNVGKPTTRDADVGLIADKTMVNQMEAVVRMAESYGIEVYQKEIAKDDASAGYFPPTVLIGSYEANSAIKNDIILPFLVVTSFRTPKEAILLANNSRYGFAASVWAKDTDMALEVVNKLEVGTVWLNCHGNFDPAVPCEGWKESGTGSFGGKAAMLDSMRYKNLSEEEDKLSRNAEATDSVAAGDGETPAVIPPIAKRKDAALAADSSHLAYQGWSANRPESRSRALYSMAGLMTKARQHLLSLFGNLPEGGKGGSEAAVDRMIAIFKYWSGACDKGMLSNTHQHLHKKLVVGSRQPLGVIAIGVCEIDLHGLLTLLWLVAGSISFGNTVVIAVNSIAPSIIMNVFKTFAGGCLPGVINVLTGNPSSDFIMKTLAGHQNIGAVFHLDIPREVTSAIHLAANSSLKPVIRFVLKPEQEFPSEALREFTELKVTRGKAIWLNGGEIFAN